MMTTTIETITRQALAVAAIKGKSSPNKLLSQQAVWKFLQVQPRKITSDSQKWDCGEAVRNYISMRLKDEFEVIIEIQCSGYLFRNIRIL